MAYQDQQFFFILLAIAFIGCHEQPELQRNPKHNIGEDTIASSIDGTTLKRLSDPSSSRITVANDGTFHAQDTLFNVIAYVADDDSVVNDATLPTDHFLIEIKPPPSSVEPKTHIRSKLKALLAEKFEITFSSVNREPTVLLLMKLDIDGANIKAASETDPRGWGTSTNGYEFRNQSFDDLAVFLSNELGEFVLNETNVTESYNFELPVDIFQTVDPASWGCGVKINWPETKKWKTNNAIHHNRTGLEIANHNNELNRNRDTALLNSVIRWIASLPFYPTLQNQLLHVLPDLGNANFRQIQMKPYAAQYCRF